MSSSFGSLDFLGGCKKGASTEGIDSNVALYCVGAEPIILKSNVSGIAIVPNKKDA